MRIDENGDAEGNYTVLAHQDVRANRDSNDPKYYPIEKGLVETAFFVRGNGTLRV